MTRLAATSLKLFALLILASGLLLFLTYKTPAEETAKAPWQQTLEGQLLDEVKCVFDGTLFVRELPVDGGVAMSGRVQCVDGRMFDFSQAKPHLKFEIRACEPIVC